MCLLLELCFLGHVSATVMMSTTLPLLNVTESIGGSLQREEKPYREDAQTNKTFKPNVNKS